MQEGNGGGVRSRGTPRRSTFHKGSVGLFLMTLCGWGAPIPAVFDQDSEGHGEAKSHSVSGPNLSYFLNKLIDNVFHTLRISALFFFCFLIGYFTMLC